MLYRKHRHRELIVERLREQDIPYVVVGGTGLFAVPEVRDVEAALRVAANPDDSTAFVRLLSAGPWRLDAAEILRLDQRGRVGRPPVYQAALDILREGEISVSSHPRRRFTSHRRTQPAAVARRCGPRRSSMTAEPETVRHGAAASSARSGGASSSTRACA